MALCMVATYNRMEVMIIMDSSTPAKGLEPMIKPFSPVFMIAKGDA